MKKIGIIDISNGLYILTHPSLITDTNLSYTKHDNNMNTRTCNNIVNNCDLWHNRLGHPSYDTLSHINKTFHLHISSKSSIVCDTCFFGKTKKTFFL